MEGNTEMRDEVDYIKGAVQGISEVYIAEGSLLIKKRVLE